MTTKLRQGMWAGVYLLGWFLLASGAAPASGLAQPAGPAPSGGQARRSLVGANETERNHATETALDTLEFDFSSVNGKPLKDILIELHAATGLQFAIDSSAKDCDLDYEAKVSFTAGSLRLRTGLDLMLEPLDGTYTIRDGVVLLISKDAAGNPDFFRLKTFDVEPLLQLLIRTERLKDEEHVVPAGPLDMRWLGLRSDVSGGMSGAVPLGFYSVREIPIAGGIPASAAEAVPTGTSATAEKQPETEPILVRVSRSDSRHCAQQTLIDLVQSHVAPDEWGETGQGDGTIEALGGVLVVGQSETILHAVRLFLEDLERKLRAIEAREAK